MARLTDDLVKSAGSSWMNDRVEWRGVALEEAYVQQKKIKLINAIKI